MTLTKGTRKQLEAIRSAQMSEECYREICEEQGIDWGKFIEDYQRS